MKQILCAIFCLFFLSACSPESAFSEHMQATTQIIYQESQTTNSDYLTYKINIDAVCLYNNSVGNEWLKTYMINGTTISNGKLITLPKDTTSITINIEVTERDKFPDTALTDITVNLKEKIVTKTTLTVTENKGRFTGNKAKWEIAVSFDLID